MINNDATTVRAAAILTTGEVNATSVQTLNASQCNVLIDFTKGSLTSVEIRAYWSPDDNDYYQESFGAISGGDDTISLGKHTISATGKYRLPIQCEDNWLRLSVKGIGTVTSSSAQVMVQLGNA